MKQPCVYIMASKRNGTLYIGVTSNLLCRALQHREGLIEGFTKKYSVHVLVWFEFHETIIQAIVREKEMKDWKRAEDRINRSAQSLLARSVSWFDLITAKGRNPWHPQHGTINKPSSRQRRDPSFSDRWLPTTSLTSSADRALQLSPPCHDRPQLGVGSRRCRDDDRVISFYLSNRISPICP